MGHRRGCRCEPVCRTGCNDGFGGGLGNGFGGGGFWWPLLLLTGFGRRGRRRLF